MGCMSSKEEPSPANAEVQQKGGAEQPAGKQDAPATSSAAPGDAKAADASGVNVVMDGNGEQQGGKEGADPIEVGESEDVVGALPGRPGGASELLHAGSMGPGEEHSHVLLQKSLPQVPMDVDMDTKAAGLKHIGFGPLKKENQDEYFVKVGSYGGQSLGSLYCIFDGHGSYGGHAAAFVNRELPVLLDQKMSKHFGAAEEAEAAGKDMLAKEVIESIISDAFVETEQRLRTAGFNVSSSGTTATVVYQNKGQLWVASAGDSRAVVLNQHTGSDWEVLPLTLDHRPGRRSEKKRVEAAGGRVEPKKLPSGKTVGEPRLWLQHIPSPGLLLSRSIGDDMASSVGCTSRPEVTYMALRPHVDQYLVVASDGVWDVLTNDQVSQLVTTAAEPEAACQAILEMALEEWEERLAADNISVIVVRYEWGQIRLNYASASTRVNSAGDAGNA